mmetsp:Transcript_35956/g.102682  ORF Transcript_35956/g.102682 Transcript_35956/m.102682 type:complete len:115 (+) Transcript_35956:161-505(+)
MRILVLFGGKVGVLYSQVRLHIRPPLVNASALPAGGDSQDYLEWVLFFLLLRFTLFSYRFCAWAPYLPMLRSMISICHFCWWVLYLPTLRLTLFICRLSSPPAASRCGSWSSTS